MAFGAPPLAHEDLLAGKLLLAGLGRIEPAEWIELRRGREIDDVLHLCHHRDVIDTVGPIDALALSADVVAVEIGGALLELREILDRTQRPLRAVNLLVEDTAQAHRIKPE